MTLTGYASYPGSAGAGSRGPWSTPLLVVVVVLGLVLAARLAWTYEQVRRGTRPDGALGLRVRSAWWAVVVTGVLVFTTGCSPLTMVSVLAALGWAISATAAWRASRPPVRERRRSHAG